MARNLEEDMPGVLADVSLSVSGEVASCYHGSNEEAFRNREYRKAAREFMEAYTKSTSEEDFHRRVQEFEDSHAGGLMINEDFCKFLFAICVNGIVHKGLRCTSKLRSSPQLRPFLRLAISIRYVEIPAVEGEQKFGPGKLSYESAEKCARYLHQIANERGAIVCLSRETPSCNCMSKAKREARSSMAKVGHCFHCQKEVPASGLLACTRCNAACYCSTECQRKDWPQHKELCNVLSPDIKNVKKVCHKNIEKCRAGFELAEEMVRKAYGPYARELARKKKGEPGAEAACDRAKEHYFNARTFSEQTIQVMEELDKKHEELTGIRLSEEAEKMRAQSKENRLARLEAARASASGTTTSGDWI